MTTNREENMSDARPATPAANDFLYPADALHAAYAQGRADALTDALASAQATIDKLLAQKEAAGWSWPERTFESAIREVEQLHERAVLDSSQSLEYFGGYGAAIQNVLTILRRPQGEQT